MTIQVHVGKHVIGHVGLGDMLIKEMLDFKPEKKDLRDSLGYDLKDDLICFMQNDPTFYRKEYFPVVYKLSEYTKAGKSVAPHVFEKLVNKAYESYKEKFPVEGLETSLEKDMCEQICNEIHRFETDNIKQGRYDD